MYLDYVKEREGYESVETEHGFAIYKIFGEECYLRDIYVKPGMRKSGEAKKLSQMVKEKALEAGCTFMTGSVNLDANNPTVSVKAILGDGFDVAKYPNNLLLFTKRI